MAHATIEWTANLDGAFDRAALMRLVGAAMRDAGGVFPLGGIRVRTRRVDEWFIADGEDPRDAFINVQVLMGAGRPAEFRQRFFDDLFARIREHLDPLSRSRPLALSLYVDEAEGWKHNTIHDRLKRG